MDKLMEIRRDDRCAACGVELPAGTTAYWIRTERIVRCVPCHTVGVESQVAHAESGPSVRSADQPIRPDASPHPLCGSGPASTAIWPARRRESARWPSLLCSGLPHATRL